MGSYKESRIDVVEYASELMYKLPLAIDDTSLSYHIGIHNKTLWWLIETKAKQYKVFSIPKRGKQAGKLRDIQNPEPRMKTVQKILLTKFLAPIPMGDHVGAYVIGRSCMDTAKQHVKKKVIISMDLKDFFPTVKRAMIREFYNYVGYPHRVSSLLADLMTYSDFVPQGAPTSGAIANLVAHNRFDRHILRDLKQLDKGWRYTRYSDDIDVSHPATQTPDHIEKVVGLVRGHIEKAGFKINEAKTKTEFPHHRQKVLGIVVNEKPNIPRYEYDRVRCLIHNCMMHGFESQLQRAEKGTIPELMMYIAGKLAYFKQIDETKANRLQDNYEVALQLYGSPPADEANFGDENKPEPALL